MADSFKPDSFAPDTATDSFRADDAPPQKTGFLGRVGQMLNPLPLAVGMANAVMHPYETIKSVVTPREDIAKEASDAYNKGQYGRAALSTAEDMPVFGAPIRQAEQDIRNKDWGALAATGASLAIPSALKAVKGRYRPSVNLNPVEQSAVNFGEKEGVPITPAMATGNRYMQAAEEMGQKMPLTTGRATRLRSAQEQALTKAGQNVAESTAPGKTGERVVAGEGVGAELTKRVQSQNVIADTAYTKLRQIADKNKVRVQTGTKPSSVLGPNGQPVMTPVYEDMALPTDVSAMQARVAPILEQLEKSIPEAQKQASPGLSVMRQIANRPPKVDINTAINDLSAIQNLARLEANELPQVRGVSRGLAASVIPQYRQAIDAAAAAGGPDAVAALNAGRVATTAKYAANKTLTALPRNAMREVEPGRVVDRLASGDDTSVQLLRQVQQQAPQSLPSVARSVVESLVDDMTNQGDIRRAQSAVRKWNKIGPETKGILFPDPAVQQSVTDFVNLAEMTTRRSNPSGTANNLMALMHGFTPKALAAQLLGGSTVFSPNGPAMARQGIPVGLGPIPNMIGGMIGYNMARPQPYKPPQENQ